MTGFKLVGKATVDRVLGEGSGPVRALIAATVVGTATAVATYRLLRSGQE